MHISIRSSTSVHPSTIVTIIITITSLLPISCVPLVSTIGLLFQVLDDYLNLQSTAYTERKGLAEDLTEGKFSFPVIHAIRSASEAGTSRQQQEPNGTNTGLSNGHDDYAQKQHQNPAAGFPSAISQPPPYTNNILLNILSQRTRDDEVKRYAVRYMEQCGSFAYTRRVVSELHADASRLVEDVAAKVGGEAGTQAGKGMECASGLSWGAMGDQERP